MGTFPGGGGGLHFRDEGRCLHLWRGQSHWSCSSKGIPNGRPMGGTGTGGEPTMPGGGVLWPIGRGGLPWSGGYWVGPPAVLAVAAAAEAAMMPLPCGVITCWDGPPFTLLAWAASPEGAWGQWKPSRDSWAHSSGNPWASHSSTSGTRTLPVSIFGRRSLYSY